MKNVQDQENKNEMNVFIAVTMGLIWQKCVAHIWRLSREIVHLTSNIAQKHPNGG